MLRRCARGLHPVRDPHSHRDARLPGWENTRTSSLWVTTSLKTFFSDLGGTGRRLHAKSDLVRAFLYRFVSRSGAMTIRLARPTAIFSRITKTSSSFAWFGTAIGIISAIAFIGVAFNPGILVHAGTYNFRPSGIHWLDPACLFLLARLALAKQKVLPAQVFAILVEFLVASILYVALLFYRPWIGYPAGLIINARVKS